MFEERIRIAAVMLAVVASAPLAGQEVAGPRVGFAEEFDTLDGWKLDNPKSPLREMKVSDGRAVFSTYVGSFMGARPPRQPVVVSATTQVYKQYDQEVNLDRYHYVVMKTDAKSMYSIAEINRKQVHVAYTTGVIAQDLATLGITGKQTLRLDIEMMNNGRALTVDYIRLVDRLSDEETAGLIGPPVRLYSEGITGHLYQRLEALDARAARPTMRLPEEKVCFRDVGTAAVTWRMTADPADEGFSERYRMWLPDGSGFVTHASGGRYYDFTAHAFRRRPPNLFGDTYQVSAYPRGHRDEVHVLKLNEQTGKMEVIYRHSKKDVKGLHSGIVGDKVVLLLAGVKLVVIDGAATDPARRVREYPVPDLSSKGGGLSSDGKWFGYFSPFGCYRKTLVNTDTGEVRLGSQFTFTHGMGGRPWSIMSYGGAAKLQVSEAASYGGNEHPGDALKVHGVWREPVRTDYGAMTSDGRWGITNGIGGELDAQHVMFDRLDPGTILRLCTYHVSKITWSVWTKAIASPDSTKLMYVSDMLGDSDFFMAVTRRPDPPRAATIRRTAAGVRLAWQPPEHHAEIRGYNIYRSTASGRGFAILNPQPVSGPAFVDASPPAGGAHYLVAPVEHSGLEGSFSPELSVAAAKAPVRLHFEAEAGTRTVPMREVFDGDASGYRAVRVTKVAPGEELGAVEIDATVLRDGAWWVWARCRNRRGGKGRLQLAVGDHTDVALPISSKEWTWIRSPHRVSLAPDSKLRLTSDDDGLALDKIVLTDDDGYQPAGPDDRTEPLPAVSGLKVAKTAGHTVELAWEPIDRPELSHYSVYVSDRPGAPRGNETVLVSTRDTTALDPFVPPGTTLHYQVVAVDRRGRESAPATVSATTPGLDVFTVELPAVEAKLGDGAEKGRDEDLAFVAYRAEADPTVTFSFKAPADGEYYFWMEYGARHGKGEVLSMALDGERLGDWQTRQPTRMGRDLEGMKVRWFVDRIGPHARYKPPIEKAVLTAGLHTLTATLGEKGPWLSKLWVTNDPTFVPPGFSAQARFNRDRRQR